MVKVKNKKRCNADIISSKKAALKKKVLNPFEVHINNEKLKVLGRKLKNDRGLPGISRAKALAKRKETLLPEFTMQNKSNKFYDKRIGERDNGLSAEDKSMARYTAVRMKQHKKKNIFNLADDEVLTHKGQTLSEIEKFDDPKSDDEDEEDSGKLNKKFVDEVHFGGGMLKKADGAKSHKDLIEQLIIESKKRKAEMQKQKEATIELTEKLDAEWKDLLPLVNKKQKTDADHKVQVDEYDIVMRELKFEARGVPSDKLKTEDEIVREEKEKLEKLEQARLERMRGIIDEPKSCKHRSADDLDDNFAYDDDEVEDVTLSYNQDGTSNVLLDIKINNKQENVSAETISADVNGEEDSGEGEAEESEVETDDDLLDLKESDSESDIENVNNKDHKSTSIPPNQKVTIIENKIIVPAHTKTTGGILKNAKSETLEGKSILKSAEEIKEDLFKLKEIMETARKELPYTFSLPKNYESLQETLIGKSSEEHGVIIERMIKCNHQSLKEGNKDALGMLFVYLLQYLNDLCHELRNEDDLRNMFKIFANIRPFLYELAQLNPENAATSLVEVIKEKQGEFRGKKKFPDVDVLVYLKLVGCLFSTSDFKHYVVNPCVLFMEQMLLKSRIKTKRDIAYGIFIVCIVMEYTVLSKRFLPAAISFLNGIIYMAIPKKIVQIIKVLPPCKSGSTLLVLTDHPKRKSIQTPKMEITDLFKSNNADIFDDDFKHIVVHVAVSLLRKSYLQLQDQPSCYEIFQPTYDYLQQLPLTYYDTALASEIHNFVSSIEEFKGNRKLQYCQMDKQKPKALRLYEPNIEKVFDAKKHKVQSKEKAELDKLMYKLKKEKKGAMREIRRDKAYLGRVMLDRKLASDAERRDKVKRIFSEAAMQQSELNAMDRGNKRKKK